MSSERQVIVSESRPFDSLIAVTNRFQRELPKLKDNNTLESMIRYLISEVDELLNELLVIVGVNSWSEWREKVEILKRSALSNTFDSDQLTTLRGVCLVLI